MWQSIKKSALVSRFINIAIFFFSGKVIDNASYEEATAAFDRLYTAGTKTGMFYYKSKTSHDLITDLNKTEAPKLLSDRYLLQPSVLIFEHHHYLFEVLNKKFEQLLEAHLIEYYIERDNDEPSYTKRLKKQEKPFKVLTLDELEAGFVVSMAPLVLSFVIFCFEWLSPLKDLLVFLYIFETYYKIRQIEQDQQMQLGKFKIGALTKPYKDKLCSKISNIQNLSWTANE